MLRHSYQSFDQSWLNLSSLNVGGRVFLKPLPTSTKLIVRWQSLNYRIRFRICSTRSIYAGKGETGPQTGVHIWHESDSWEAQRHPRYVWLSHTRRRPSPRSLATNPQPSPATDRPLRLDSHAPMTDDRLCACSDHKRNRHLLLGGGGNGNRVVT